MKTSALLAAAVAATAARATGAPDASKINCAKAHANYCVAGDIILRCDEKAVGVKGRCSDNVAGYPPFGGTAVCYESSKEAGDAACQKNCVVYARPAFTLSADQCTPSYTATPVVASDTDSDETGMMSIPEGTGAPPPPNTKLASIPEGSGTGIMSIPEGTGSPSGTSTQASGTATASTSASIGSETGIMSIPEGTSLGTATPSSTVADTRSIQTSQSNSDSSSESPTESPTATDTTSGTLQSTASTTTPVSTAGVSVNRPSTPILAAAGLAAAFLM